MSYPIANYGRQANKKYSEGYTDWKWESIHVKDLNNIKEAVVACGIFSICEADVEYVALKGQNPPKWLKSINLSSIRRWYSVRMEKLVERRS